jgi:hypothetical protein
MVRNFFAVVLAYVVLGAWAFSGKHKDVKTVITGKLSPADAANAVWVLSGKDSTQSKISEGIFSVEVKPGVHQVIVDARNPYKDVYLDHLNVTENEVLDLGEITLKQ